MSKPVPRVTAPRKRACAKCGVTRIATQFANERARVCTPCKRATSAANNRARRLDDKYGITPEEDKAIYEAQGKQCAGCGGKRKYFLHVDHDHALERQLLAAGMSPKEAARGSVRAKLCARCNKILRDSRDNADTLLRLVKVLRNPPARKVLDK